MTIAQLAEKLENALRAYEMDAALRLMVKPEKADNRYIQSLAGMLAETVLSQRKEAKLRESAPTIRQYSYINRLRSKLPSRSPLLYKAFTNKTEANAYISELIAVVGK